MARLLFGKLSIAPPHLRRLPRGLADGTSSNSVASRQCNAAQPHWTVGAGRPACAARNSAIEGRERTVRTLGWWDVCARSTDAPRGCPIDAPLVRPRLHLESN